MRQGVLMPFVDRADAGRRLARELLPLAREDPVILGLPRGGVVVAHEVAKGLSAPLDVIVVRKLGVPFQPELAMGAIGEGGVSVLNESVLRSARIGRRELTVVADREERNVVEQARLFRQDRPRIPLENRTVTVIDDGIATGATARAACQIAREQGADRIVLAIPVAAQDTIGSLRAVCDDLICLEIPQYFSGVGQFYADFGQTTDIEVTTLLASAATVDNSIRDEEVELFSGSARLAGHLTIPEAAPGLIIFAHGSGSGRFSPRNQFVAKALNDAGFGTLLFDLLTPFEESDRAKVFDIELLASRLADVARQMEKEADWLGFFGASTGSAAALRAAAEEDIPVKAVVSRGGRPDLAASHLSEVSARTLLVVGGADYEVIELNRNAQERLRCENELAIVPGATHLFEEPGALEEVAELASDWFIATAAKI